MISAENFTVKKDVILDDATIEQLTVGFVNGHGFVAAAGSLLSGGGTNSINVSAAANPVAGQVLTATSVNTAVWAPPPGESNVDNIFEIVNAADPTRKINFYAGNGSHATETTLASSQTANLTINIPDGPDFATLITDTGIQSLFNKTLVGPTVSGSIYSVGDIVLAPAGDIVPAVSGVKNLGAPGATFATVYGNATSASVLTPGRTINGVLFNGSANITVPAAAGTLTGTTLAAGVVTSSLTSVGQLLGLAMNGTITAVGSQDIGTVGTPFAHLYATQVVGTVEFAQFLSPGANINGVLFDGSTNILIPIDASAITGQVAIAHGGTGQATPNAGFNALSPMSASGDLIYGGAAGAAQRLGIGGAGQVLTVVGGLPAWQMVTGTGTVTSVSVVSANGLAGTVANPTSTPAITLSTSVTGIVKGDGTALSAATSGTDYSAGTSALGTGILKSTTGTGALTIAIAADFPTLNQNTTGTAANVTGIVAVANGGTNLASAPANGQLLIGNTTGYTLAAITPGSGISVTNGAGSITIASGFSSLSIVTANGFAGSVSNPITTPAITLSTTVTGIVKGDGTTLSAATSGTDYSAGTSALGTGILKSTTGTGALTIAIAADFPILNQNTTGTASNVTGIVAIANGGTGQITVPAAFNALSPMTTTGDIIYEDVAGANRLGIGGPGTFLGVSGGIPAWTAAATSVGLSAPVSVFSVAGSPVTGTGTLALSFVTQTANTIFAGPASGAAATPTFRSMALADLPTLTSGQLYIGSTGVAPVAATITGSSSISVTNGAGSITLATPAGSITNAMLVNDAVTVTAGTCLTGGGTVVLGSSITLNVGTVTIAHGGTNSVTALNNNQIMVSSSGAIVEAGAMTNGQLLIGSTGAAPVVAALSAGTGISITNGAGTITIANTAPGTGTVTSVSVTSANGFAGTVATATTTPAITISTTITGLVKGNGTAISAATSGTDYSAGTSALGTGILKSTTGTGALTIAIAADFPTLNQNTTGTASNVTGIVAIANGGTNSSTGLTNNQVMVSASGAIKELGAMTNGQLVIGSTGAAPVVAAISAGTGISVTNGAGTITIANTGGTVTSASVVSANGFAGTVATATTTPAITISTSVTGLLKGNGTAISAATSGTDYSAGTSALGTGILKSTTGTGALTIAIAADFPTLNQNTTGTASNVTGIVTGTNGGTGVNNDSKTITIGGSVTFSGAFTTQLTVTGTTSVTLPTSGTVWASGNTNTNSSQPAFSATNSTGRTNVTGDGTVYTMIFNTVNFNHGGSNFDGTSTFTAPVTGVYFFSCQIQLIGLTASHTLAVMAMPTTTTAGQYQLSDINPAPIRDSGGNLIISTSLIIAMTSGNTAQISIQVNNGAKVVGIYGVSQYSLFSGYLVA